MYNESSKRYFKNFNRAIGEQNSGYPRKPGIKRERNHCRAFNNLLQPTLATWKKAWTLVKKSTKRRSTILKTFSEEKLNELERQNNHLNNKINDVETKNLYLEAYSWRENIKFENINKDDNDDEDTEKRLRTFLETDLGFRDAHTVEIQRVHRLGKKKTNESRPILARFLRFKDCEKILSLKRRLRRTAYTMYQDLPHEIVQRRKN